MKRLFIMLLVACSALITSSANPMANPQKKPETVIFTLNSIISKFGLNEGQVYSVNRNPNTGIIESSTKIVPFRCSANAVHNDNILNAVALNFPKEEPMAYQFLHIQPGSNENFQLEVISDGRTGNLRIRTKKTQEMWLMCCKNPENPQLRDAYAVTWEMNDQKNQVLGTVYMITSLRPDLYEKSMSGGLFANGQKNIKKTFTLAGRVGDDLTDSLYVFYMAPTADSLNHLNDDAFWTEMPVENRRFNFSVEIDRPMVGRIRTVMPDGSLCKLWTNIDCVPGETYHITTHNGWYEEDRDYERRVGRYSGKSLLNDRQKRGIDDVDELPLEEDTLFVDTIPNYEPEAQRPITQSTSQWKELLKIKLASKMMTIKTSMESIKASYSFLKPAFETRDFSGMKFTIGQIAKQNEKLDANFQDFIKTLKKTPEIPQKEKLEVISGGYKSFLEFYTEQNQIFTKMTKELGYLPKEFQKLQKVIHKLIEKNMNEMFKMLNEMK